MSEPGQSLPFTPEEFRSRMSRVQTAMADQELDLLVITDPCNLYYLSGYDAWSFYVDQALLVPPDGDPVWVGREMDQPAAAATTWLHPTHLVPYPDSLVQASDCHPMEFVADEIARRGWARGHIGLELDGYFFSPRARDVLASQLTDEAQLEDASDVVRWLRAVKSPAELAYLSEAAQIVEAAMNKAIDLVREGARQSAIVAEVYREQIRGVGGVGGQYTSTPPLMPTGRRTAAPHLSWTDNDLRAGEPTTIELVASRHRYHTPLARTVFLGEPTSEYLRTAEAAVEVLTETLDQVKPGMTSDDTARIWHEGAGSRGISKSSRLGYSFGIAYPPTFGERTLSIRRGDSTVLEENMTLHLIPGIWSDDWGLVISEPILITAEGATPLCSVPRRLIIKK